LVSVIFFMVKREQYGKAKSDLEPSRHTAFNIDQRRSDRREKDDICRALPR